VKCDAKDVRTILAVQGKNCTFDLCDSTYHKMPLLRPPTYSAADLCLLAQELSRSRTSV
jgi:hypothetical protein